MNSYNQFAGYNYSESSDSNTSQASPQYYDYSNENMLKQFKKVEEETYDHEMSDDSMSLNESILMSKNLNTDIYKPPVNRGGRKQVKIGTTKRNARERNRVRYINNCFEILREHIPFEVIDEQKNRKLSKVETLKYAALYIRQLTDLLESSNSGALVKSEPSRLDNIQMNTNAAFNNININVYDANRSHDLYSPTSSTSSSSSASSSYNGPYLTTGYYNNETSFSKKSCASINYFNYDQQTNWNQYHHHDYKW